MRSVDISSDVRVEAWTGPQLAERMNDAMSIYVLAMNVHPPVQVLLTYVWVWFLLIVPVEEMLVFMRDAIWADPDADTAKLRKFTLLPSALWGLLLLAGTLAALVYGGAMLLRLPT